MSQQACWDTNELAIQRSLVTAAFFEMEKPEQIERVVDFIVDGRRRSESVVEWVLKARREEAGIFPIDNCSYLERVRADDDILLR